MKEITLTKGMVTIVDDEDFDFLYQFKWCAHKGRNTYYAARNSSRKDGPRKLILMHNVIAGDLPPGFVRDHKDGNGLNNQRNNIRTCTAQQNQMNSRPRKNTSSTGFRGVSHFKRDNKWEAYINLNGKRRHLGLFPTKEDAARAYNNAAKELYGEYANLTKFERK